MKKIKVDLQEGKNVKLQAYSQGAIIVQNALCELKAEMAPGRWRESARKINVFTFGAKLFGWPDGISVEQRVNSGDWIPRLMGAISWVRHLGEGAATTHKLKSTDSCIDWLKNQFGRIWCKITAQVFEASPNSHDFASYTGRTISFELQPFRDQLGNLRVAEAAAHVVGKIKKGEISDFMATRLISDCLSEAGSEFAHEFNRYLDSGSAAKGKATIGKFVVPTELTRKYIPSGIPQRSFRIEPDSEELALCA